MLIFYENLCLEIDDEQLAHLEHLLDENNQLEEEAFALLSIGMKQMPKMVIGENEEGGYPI